MSVRVSIVIPTRNRKELLRKAIASCYALDQAVEVIVMDDASTDGSVEMVRQEFPQVIVRSSDKPVGPCVLRNRAAEFAAGEFLLTLDDDCTFASPATVSQTLALFNHPAIAAVTIPFINVNQLRQIDSAAPTADGIFVTALYYGGMVMLRREIFLRAGGYRPQYFIQVEEPDLAVRLLERGYVVRLGSGDAMEHHESAARNNPLREVVGARNQFLFGWYNAPFPEVIEHLARTTIMTFGHALRTKHPLHVLKGIGQAYGKILTERHVRRPVGRKTYRLMRQLRRRGSIRFEEIEPLMEAKPF